MKLRRVLAVLIGGAALALIPGIAHAQTIDVLARAGHCQVQVSGTIGASATLVVQRDGAQVFKKKIGPGALHRTINVKTPIGTTTAIKVSLDAKPIAVALAQADGTSDGCTAVDEDTEVFNASGFVGLSIDTFAAQDLSRYLNPNDSGDARLHSTAGVNFEYRALRTGQLNLWIEGETLHNAKSTDVDCAKTPQLDTCKGLGFDPTRPGEQFLAILRNAGSVEANVSLRLEFLELNRSSLSPAALYGQVKLGFLSVAGSDGDAALFNTYSIGLIATGGRFGGSYLDAGFGRSEIYREFPNKRFKVDGLLSIELAGVSTMRPYIQMTIDADLRGGPDSIQTFIGIDFDLRSIFGK